MRITMCCCESTMLDEIANKQMRQRDVAQSYRLAMESHEASTVNWGKVHRAIIERWSRSGLERIKEMAHSGKCFA